MRLRFVWFFTLVVVLLGLNEGPVNAADRWKFRIKLGRTVRSKPFSGRLYLFFSQRKIQPRFGPDWFNSEPFVAKDVSDWKPGETVEFSSGDVDGLLAYPRELEKLDLAGYRVQAVARFNPHERKVGRGAGNGFSEVVKVIQTGEVYNLTIADTIRKPTYKDSRWSRELRVRSKLLSDFHKREVEQAAAVFLPQSYFDQPNRRYPVLFTIPGFSGEHYSARLESPIPEANPGGVEFIRVILNPSCEFGHHVFADSANNGPRGRCLIEEFIPELDRQYRTLGKPTARFLTGHSSGGWTSLWLQVTYPDLFGGCWSTAPDPVDFTDFSRVNIYKDKNLFVDNAGKRRPLGIVRGQVRMWYKGFSDMEHVLGHGGQLRSFEAVFGQRGSDGRPTRLWNRETGELDHDVAKTWEDYDIRLILQRNWQSLGPRLKGKIHVFMGSQDTFLLTGATVKLKKALADLSSDAKIEIQPGKDHSSILRGGLQLRIRKEIAEKFLEYHPEENRQ